VPEQYLARIFEPFFRVNGGGDVPDGISLGLAIARRVFTAHGGTVSAESRAGGGLVFTIRLPAAELT